MKGAFWFSIASLLGVPMLLVSCGSSGTTPPPTVCDQLTGYKASSTTALSFASDVLPILQNQMSCGLGSICHGAPPIALNASGTKTLQFGPAGAVTAAMVKTSLLGPSVNAPTMNRVMPSNVGASFLAYQLSGTDGLACIASKCMAGATVGTMTACGDSMPRVGGTLSASDKTKILDWIAQGAAD